MVGEVEGGELVVVRLDGKRGSSVPNDVASAAKEDNVRELKGNDSSSKTTVREMNICPVAARSLTTCKL